MMKWKIGLGALLVGAGAICGGCGSESEGVEQTGTVASPATEAQALTTARFAVEGMTCGGCAIATEMAVRKLQGVSSVDASHEAGSATVTYDPGRVDAEAIADAIRTAGFTPTLQREDRSTDAAGQLEESR